MRTITLCDYADQAFSRLINLLMCYVITRLDLCAIHITFCKRNIWILCSNQIQMNLSSDKGDAISIILELSLRHTLMTVAINAAYTYQYCRNGVKQGTFSRQFSLVYVLRQKCKIQL